MHFLFRSLSLPAITIFLVAVSGCNGGNTDGKKNGASDGKVTVTARSMSDTDMLNPINLATADGRYMADLIFAKLLDYDPKTYEIVPYLAVARPTITEVTEEGPYLGNLRLDFEIRPEATWDDGSPVTGEDYAFTIKSILNPKTNCQPLKPYYEWVNDIVIDAANPKKFSVYAKEKYFKVEEFAGYYVLPEKIYDPQQIMRKFKITDLNSDAKRTALKENADISNFATSFNSPKYQREKEGVIGGGPYAFDNWITNQTVTLLRKKDWWGDKVKIRNTIAYPDKIVFKVVGDPNTAIVALKDGEVDECHGIEGMQYEELLKNEKAKEKLKLAHPSIFSYSYISFNLRSPKLEDIRVRKALAHAINKAQINETISFNRNVEVETFVHPTQKHFNGDIKPFGFNLDSSRILLDAAGWKDTDGDGFRDKVINGERTKLSLTFHYPINNKGREMAGILIKDDWRKIGVELNLTGKEWNVFRNDMDHKNFEVSYSAFTMDPTMSDPKQLWHTSAAATGGSNSTSFGNPQTDKLIDDIRAELDETKRAAMYKELQKIIHDEIPVVFLFIPVNRLGVNKRFEVELSLIDPGYRHNEFLLVESAL